MNYQKNMHIYICDKNKTRHTITKLFIKLPYLLRMDYPHKLKDIRVER